MKTNVKILSACLCTLVLGVSINNMAVSKVPNVFGYKIAVVDVQKVVENSSDVKSLKDEQQKKLSDLQSFVNNAKRSLANEPNKTKQKQLEDKYNKELQEKTADIQKEYAKKLQEIDKNISEKIKQEAKEKSYNLILSKGIVLYGGDDITLDIISKVK